MEVGECVSVVMIGCVLLSCFRDILAVSKGFVTFRFSHDSFAFVFIGIDVVTDSYQEIYVRVEFLGLFESPRMTKMEEIKDA